MGWGRMFFLGDWGQQYDIETTKDEVAQLKRELRASRSASVSEVDVKQSRDIAELQKENDELRLYIAMLTRTLVRKRVLTINEIGDLVKFIDETP